MSDQDSEDFDDLLKAIKKMSRSGHVGDNHGRIFDGCLFVTQGEWDLVSAGAASKTWNDMTLAERLSSIPIRILPNGGAEQLSDGRTLVGFADKLYLLPQFEIPPLPRLHLDGMHQTKINDGNRLT